MVTFRNATTGDVPLIRTIADATWPATYSSIIGQEQIVYMLGLFYAPEVLTQQVGDPQNRFVIASLDDKDVAFAHYAETEPAKHKLHKLYLLPGLQGNGIGKQLIAHIENGIRQQHGTTLYLNVNRYNAKAIAFYTKAGFHKTHDEDIDIGNGYFMNDYIMSKLIE